MVLNRRGMTLIEIMVVVAILGILAVAIGVSVIGYLVEVKRKAARMQVDSVSQSVLGFAGTRGYPESLQEVVDARFIPRKKLVDPWNQQLLYAHPSTREHYVYDVCSLAEDGVARSPDDICNEE